MSEQQVIFAPSWGRRWSDPGVANQALARRISRLVGDRREEFLIFAQWEVADALLEERIAVDHVVRNPEFTHYITTKYVLHEMWEEIRVHGYYRDFRYMLVTHPLHADRCRELVLDLGIPKSQLFSFECEEVYDPHSIHPWTWNRSLYLASESLYRFTAQFLPL
jgi:hypothetical protein